MKFNLSKWAFANSKLVQFLVAVLVVGGIFSAWAMSKLEDPEIKVKLSVVATVYPGASAHQVELEVTDPLEKAIRSISNVSNVESVSMNDLSVINVELQSTVRDEDVEQCWDMLRRKVSDCAATLPPGAQTPMVQEDFSNVYGLFYAMTAEGFPPREMEDYAQLIRRSILDLDGVDKVQLYGVPTEVINISLNRDRMANLGVKPLEVISTLNNQNDVTYAGYFDTPEQRIRVNVTDRLNSVEAIGDMLLAGHEDDRLHIKDIADVERTLATPQRNRLLRDSVTAIGILVSGRHGSDIVKVGKEVDELLSQLRHERLPAGIEVHSVFNQPERVTDALTTFFVNLVESVAIVVLILMLAMGLRSGVMIGISLVTIVLGSFLFLFNFGGTMQRVSLGAFILAMGMLVDNAIVIIDGILVDLKRGIPRREALTGISARTAMPLLGATLIAILAFLPIFLSPDTTGIYVRDLFIVLAVSLLLSWALALVHVPLMADRYLKGKSVASAEKDLYKGRAYRWLRSLVTSAIHHKYVTVGIMGALLMLSVFGFRYVRQGFFPDMAYDQLYMEYKLPDGTSPDRVGKDLAEIEAYFKTLPYVRNITTSIGGAPGRYNLVRSIPTPNLAYGELIIDFTSPGELRDHIEEMQQYVSSHYPEAYAKLKRYNLMFKKYPIEAQFTGPDPAVLSALADSAERIMERLPQVRLITRDLEPRVPVLQVEYNQGAARMSGLSRKDVSLSMLTATGGVPIATLFDGTHPTPIYLKQTTYDHGMIEDIENISVFSTLPDVSALVDEDVITSMATGVIDKDMIIDRMMSTTPLTQVADGVTVEWENPVIPRYNSQRSVRVQASPSPGIETEKARVAVEKALEAIELPTGYALSWQGEKAASDQSMRYLFQNFPLAIILMIALLIMLFKDYRKPLIIFCTIPMVVVGIVITMIITGKTFDFVAIVGTLGLIGMVIKNGIVLMDEIERLTGEGMEQRSALIQSSVNRLRAVSLAALTTILGMLPLLSDSMFGSMAAAIMGGLLFGTVITLVFIPVLYSLFFHVKK